MRDAHSKMSKRHGDPSYEDLIAQGYLTTAVLNYVALLGWAPKGELSEQEIFSLDQLVDAFDIAGISKSPAIFDLAKLDYFNATYLRALAPEEFSKIAVPYIRKSVQNPSIDAAAVAALLQARCEKLTEIPEKVDFFDALPDYDVEFYVNKKSKTDKAVSKDMLSAAIPMALHLPEKEDMPEQECPMPDGKRLWKRGLLPAAQLHVFQQVPAKKQHQKACGQIAHHSQKQHAHRAKVPDESTHKRQRDTGCHHRQRYRKIEQQHQHPGHAAAPDALHGDVRR